MDPLPPGFTVIYVACGKICPFLLHEKHLPFFTKVTEKAYVPDVEPKDVNNAIIMLRHLRENPHLDIITDWEKNFLRDLDVSRFLGSIRDLGADLIKDRILESESFLDYVVNEILSEYLNAKIVTTEEKILQGVNRILSGGKFAECGCDSYIHRLECRLSYTFQSNQERQEQEREKWRQNWEEWKQEQKKEQPHTLQFD
jgi:hypothetical protein